MQVSHSMMQTWRRCRRRFFWHYVCGYVPVRKAKGLAVGSAGHAALSSWYSDKNSSKALAIATESLADAEGIELLDKVLIRYFDWAVENDDFAVLSTELKFRMPLGNHVLYGIVDGVIRRTDGTVWVLEHKFNKQASTEHLGLDIQCSIYMAALQTSGYAPCGVLYNVVRMQEGGVANTKPVLRDYTFRSDHSAQLTSQEIQIQANDIDRYLKCSLATQEYISYRNPDATCHWQCEFYNVCLSRQDNGDLGELETQFGKEERHGA